jgi:hypothetical protein
VLPRTQLRVDPYAHPCERIRLLERMADEAAARGELSPLEARARQATRFGGSQRAVAEAALATVQGLPYYPEAKDQQWFKPIAWTVGRGGSCGPLSAVLYGLCKRLGLDAQVVWITQAGRALNHLSVLVMVDGAWQWADPSVRGARLGEDPYAAIERLGQWNVIT